MIPDSIYWKCHTKLLLTKDGEFAVNMQLGKLNAKCIVCQSPLLCITLTNQSVIVCSNDSAGHRGVTWRLDPRSRGSKPRLLGKSSGSG